MWLISVGGPGKGMHSRLYLRVLNEYQQIQSFSAFNSIFNNTGLFGIYENIGMQILTYGERKSVQSFLKMVDEVTLCDITDMAEKIISSPLTMASYGDVINVPSYESVSSKFRSKGVYHEF
ncbi:hypothetical protein CRYUN_Cryun31cG0080200 [Craigia yunnanensis]